MNERFILPSAAIVSDGRIKKNMRDRDTVARHGLMTQGKGQKSISPEGACHNCHNLSMERKIGG